MRRKMMMGGKKFRRVNFIAKTYEEATTYIDTKITPSAEMWLMFEYIPLSVASNNAALHAGSRVALNNNQFCFCTDSKLEAFRYGNNAYLTNVNVYGRDVQVVAVGSRHSFRLEDSIGHKTTLTINKSANNTNLPIFLSAYNQNGTYFAGNGTAIGRFGAYIGLSPTDIRTNFRDADVWFSPIQVLASGLFDIDGIPIEKGEFCMLNEITGEIHTTPRKDKPFIEYIPTK